MPVALMAPLSPMKQAPPSTVSPAPKKNPFFIFFGLGLLMVAGAAWIWFKRAKAWDSRMNPVLQALIRCREFPNLKNRIRHRVRFFCSVVTDGSSEGSTRASRVVFGALAKDRRRKPPARAQVLPKEFESTPESIKQASKPEILIPTLIPNDKTPRKDRARISGVGSTISHQSRELAVGTAGGTATSAGGRPHRAERAALARGACGKRRSHSRAESGGKWGQWEMGSGCKS